VAILLVVGVTASNDDSFETIPSMSLMEVGSESSISSDAAPSMQEVAKLLVEAKHSIARLNQSRQPMKVLQNRIQIH